MVVDWKLSLFMAFRTKLTSCCTNLSKSVVPILLSAASPARLKEGSLKYSRRLGSFPLTYCKYGPRLHLI